MDIYIKVNWLPQVGSCVASGTDVWL